MTQANKAIRLTLVVGVSGQPFAFGAAGGANDADCVPALHRQVVLPNLAGHHHLGVVHGFLFAGHLERQISATKSAVMHDVKMRNYSL